MFELLLYKQGGSKPIEIGRRQFELVDRTNASETRIYSYGRGISADTSVFKDGKIVEIKNAHRYNMAHDYLFSDELGRLFELKDIPEIKAYCIDYYACFKSEVRSPYDVTFNIIIIEHLGQPSTPRTRKKTRKSMLGFNTSTEREMLMIVSSSKGSVSEQESIITDTPIEAYKLGKKLMHDNMSKLQEGEVMEIEIVDVESDKTMMLLNSCSEVHKKQ